MDTLERTGTFIRSLEPDLPEYLQKIEDISLEAFVPIIRKESQSVLKTLIALHRPKEILEIGTAVGFSALLMRDELMSLGENSDITTIEYFEPRFPHAIENFTKAGVRELYVTGTAEAAFRDYIQNKCASLRSIQDKCVSSESTQNKCDSGDLVQNIGVSPKSTQNKCDSGDLVQNICVSSESIQNKCDSGDFTQNEGASTRSRYMNAEGYTGIDRIRLIGGDALEVLPGLKGFYDLVFLDAAKAQYINMLPYIKELMAPGGILVTDNVLQDGDILESRYVICQRDRTIHSRIRDYLYTIKHDPELESTILSVGDGMAVSVKK